MLVNFYLLNLSFKNVPPLPPYLSDLPEFLNTLWYVDLTSDIFSSIQINKQTKEQNKTKMHTYMHACMIE